MANTHAVLDLMQSSNSNQCMRYIYNDLLGDLDQTMVGEGGVTEELRTFGERCECGASIA